MKRTPGPWEKKMDILMAAAPDLLEACEQALNYFCDYVSPVHPIALDLRAVIAKAKGEKFLNAQ